MKLDWIHVRESTKRLENPIKMSIHKYVGCGNTLFLTCRELQISQLNLKTEDWDIAEEKAVEAVRKTANNLSIITDRLIQQYFESDEDCTDAYTKKN